MNTNYIIKNGHIVDPSQGIDGIGDLFIESGRIKDVVLQEGTAGSRKRGTTQHQGGESIDAKGLFVIPGLVDMHTHLREPGFEYKETIRTGTLAATKGGFTSVCAMPNTHPVNDNATVATFIIKKAMKEGACTVFPIGAITKAQKGEELAEMGIMREAGCVAFSDDGKPVMNALIMRRALEYSKVFGVPIISHCEDIDLAEGGVMNEGKLSAILGLKGAPGAAEEVMVSRDIILAEMTGGRLHIAHVSTKGSVELIRRAKEKGIRVTAETCPHYFTLTEDAVDGYNTNAKVNPPLRTEEDMAAIKEGLRDGTIDVIATDHAPHHMDEKLMEFDRTPSGISGIETALPLSLRLIDEKVLSLPELVRKMALNPATILGVQKGTLRTGADADVTIIDLNRSFTVETERLLSKGKNTPYTGWILKGCAVGVLVKGTYIVQGG